MTFQLEMIIVLRVLLGAFLGALIGYEREIKVKPAGLRTHILVCIGATLLTALSLEAFPGSDTARVAASVVIGIGFLGAGTILQLKQRVFGLTTAASLWVTASIGMTVGAGLILVGTLVTLIVLWILRLSRVERLLHR